MKFTLSWLKSFIDLNCTIDELLETLTKIGLEVDEYIDYGTKYKDFNCVLVEDVKLHPDSDHLHICTVKTNKETLNIVCGAPNVHSGMKAVLAPIGSVLPNGIELKKTKIRGVESCGMLCSEKELELGEDHNGIIELDNNIEIGTNVAKIYNLDDLMIDISITPNRSDCLGVYGIARELSAAGIGTLKTIENKAINSVFNTNIKLNVNDSNCKVFTFREIKNVKNCESPKWLKKQLSAIGVNPKNALVDIGNYVMFSFNTPLHCYDADKIDNEIDLYPAKEGTEFIDLFDKKYSLPEGATLISDKNKPLCLAGIIGSKASGSDLDTNRVVVESAIFDPINTAKTGRKLNLQTDARFRFERGSDYNCIRFASDFACNLIKDICGGEIGNLIEFEQPNYANEVIKIIKLSFSDIERLLGISIEKETVKNILLHIGYKIKELNDETLELTVPTWKNNILIKEDIIDDIIRFYGYEHLEEKEFTDPQNFEKQGNLFNTKLHDKLFKIRKRLANNGLSEVVSYSFSNKDENAHFETLNNNLELLNPIISDLSYMRQNILVNLVNIVKKNNNRGFDDLSLFEIGNVFVDNDSCLEKLVLGGIRTGVNVEKNIYNDNRKFDVFDVKKELFDALAIFNINGEKLLIDRNVPKYYHPNRSGTVKLGKMVIGYFGELHPQILKDFDVKNRIMAFELMLDKLPDKVILEDTGKKAFKVNDLQPIERSFAFILDKNVEVGNMIKDIVGIDKEFISSVKLFDLYQENKDSAEKSAAFQVIIQPKDKTLDKNEIDSICNKIIDFVKTKYNGILRDGK